MARPPTAAQRRVIDAADPVTGRLKGTEAQLEALVKRGLAFRHPRPPHDHFLTPAGHRVRESVPEEPERSAEQAADPATGVFAAHVGGTQEAADTGPARAREVHSAWQGLLELRRMTNPDGATDRPCGWERAHLVQAAALALEAAGHPPEAGAPPATGCARPRSPRPWPCTRRTARRCGPARAPWRGPAGRSASTRNHGPGPGICWPRHAGCRGHMSGSGPATAVT